jgi:hypothetical protein
MAGVLLVSVLALSACSGSGGGNDESGGSSAGSASMAEPAPVAAAGSEKVSSAQETGRSVVPDRSLIMKAELWMTSKHPARVRDQVDQLLAAVGGSVSDDETFRDHDGERSTITMRVPAAAFAATRTSIGKLGTVKHTESTSEDVTTQVIDVDQRVTTLEGSLDRLHRFQRTATDVADLLRYENDITARSSELQSLRAQQTYLHDQTAMSTLTLHLSSPSTYVAPPGALDHAGFLTGLTSGWHALGDVVVVALTVLGAVLPFLLVAALLAVPLLLLLRALLPRLHR